MKRLFFIGYMGAGKTTIGKALSKELDLSFVDLDHFIEGRYHKTVRQLFVERGEKEFREIEKNALHEVAQFENIIISTGGGTPCFYDNMSLMNSVGLTVYLKASVEELINRIELSKHTRPVLKDLSGEALIQFVSQSLAERSLQYEQAHIIFDAEIMETEKDITDLCMRLKEKVLFFEEKC